MTDAVGPGPVGDDHSPVDASEAVRMAALIERSLAGPLPCVSCRYDLKGLSILGVCPECGTAVRATILAVVDPHAAELQPIRSRWGVALGLIVWVVGALLAMTIVCASVARDWAGAGTLGLVPAEWLLSSRAVAACVWLSGLGAVMLVRPHEGISLRHRLMAAAAVVLYVPLGLVVLRLGDLAAESARAGAVVGVAPIVEHTIWRITAFGLVLGILVGLRPNARLLVARSLALRTGRVDRQTMLAMCAAVALLILGDLITLLTLFVGGLLAEFCFIFGMGLMIIGAILLLIGLIGSAVDAARIARAVMAPAPGLGQVLGVGRGAKSE